MARVAWYDIVLFVGRWPHRTVHGNIRGQPSSAGSSAIRRSHRLGGLRHVGGADGGAAPHRRLEPAAQRVALHGLSAVRRATWLGPLKGNQSTLDQTTAYHMLSTESLLGIPIQAFADTVIGFLVFGTALMMTGAGKFFINLAFALCGTFRGGAAKVGIFASRPARHDVGQHRQQRADRRHHDHPDDEAHRLPRVLRRRHRSLRLDRRGAGAAGDGRHRVRHGAVHGHDLRRGGGGGNHPGSPVLCRPLLQVDSYAARNDLKGLDEGELPSAWQTLKDGWYYAFVIVLVIVMLLYFKRESHAPFYATAMLLVLNQWPSPASGARQHLNLAASRSRLRRGQRQGGASPASSTPG